MSRRLALFRRPLASAAAFLLIAAAVAAGAVTTAAAAPAAPAAAWGVAQPIPGLAGAIPFLGASEMTTASCGGPGDCVVGGEVNRAQTNDGDDQQGIVIAENAGVWSPPVLIAGEGGEQDVTRVLASSCASPGNCVAGGYDSEVTEPTGQVDTSGAFIISEVSGVWGSWEQVPGTDALNQGSSAMVTSVSCPATGDCAVTGYVSSGLEFTDSETNGTWADAQLVPGFGTMDVNGATFYPALISCSRPGDCVVAGVDEASGKARTSVAAETNGVWGSAGALPDTSDGGAVTSLSCTAPGDCTAGGWTGSAKGQVPFVADETGGRWTVRPVPGFAAFSPSGLAGSPQVSAVSCTTPGDCSAGGEYQASAKDRGAFAVSELNGTWQTARPVPGTTPAAGAGGVAGISCTAPGDCSAAVDMAKPQIADEVNGTWGPARLLAGTTGGAGFAGISCSAPGACFAAEGGYFVEKSAHAATLTVVRPLTAKVTYGHEQAEKLSVAVTATTPSPSGKVTVAAGKTRVCVITLGSGGAGQCTVALALFGPGTVRLTASYGGGPGYAASSGTAAFAVVKAGSSTTLKLSPVTAVYGQEQREKLTVAVAPQYAGRPSGTVTVLWRGVTICKLTLAHASGSCTLTARQLRPGSYHLVPKYAGDANFNGSSANKTLTILS